MSEGKAKVLYPCEICGRSFLSEVNLDMHYKTHKEKNYPCSSCNKRFHIEKKLNDHVLEIHPFKCDQCGESFRMQKKLNKHLGTHEEKTLYPCDLCHVQFAKIARLETHRMEVHGREKPCEQCDRGSDCGGYFDGRMKFHRRERFCKLCGQSFNSFHDLMKHVKKNHSTEQHAPPLKQALVEM